MRSNSQLLILMALASISLTSGLVQAEENDGFHIRSHRKLYSFTTMSSRARGLGHSYVALSNGAMGAVENPAGLGAQTDHELIMELGLDEVDDGGDYASIISVNAGGSININHTAPHYWQRETMGNHTLGVIVHHDGLNYDEADGKYGGMTGATFGYGRSFFDGRYFGGVAFTYAQGGLEDDDRTIDQDLSRWELKGGLIARPTRELAIGGSFSYGRGDINEGGTRFSDDGEIRHFEIRLGGAYQITDDLLIAGDISREDLDTQYQENTRYDEHDIWTFSAGLERVAIPDTLTLRGGMYLTTDSYNARGTDASSQTDDYLGITLGASFYHENFELGYTFDGRLNGEFGNYFTVGFEW